MELPDKEAMVKLTTGKVTGGLLQNDPEVVAQTGIRAGLLAPAAHVNTSTKERPFNTIEQRHYWLMDDGSVREFVETHTVGAGETGIILDELGTKVGINGRVEIDADGKTSLVFDKVSPTNIFSKIK